MHHPDRPVTLIQEPNEWVKLSWFVHVTVWPAAMVIADGSNRYDLGRSTLVVAVGCAASAPPPAGVESTGEEGAREGAPPANDPHTVGRTWALSVRFVAAAPRRTV